MALLGSVDHVKKLLQASPDSVWSDDETDRLTYLQGFVTRWIEHETGQVFGTGSAPVAAERVVTSYGIAGALWLPTGVTEVDAVYEWPVWSGTAWGDGTLIDPSGYYLDGAGAEAGVYSRLVRIAPYLWNGRYRISATWAGEYEAIPEDVTYVADYMIVHLFRGENESTAGFIGSDGALVPIKNVFTDQRVVDTLNHYSRRGVSSGRGGRVVIV